MIHTKLDIISDNRFEIKVLKEKVTSFDQHFTEKRKNRYEVFLKSILINCVRC